MKQKAKLVCEYEKESIAEAIASSVQPDNVDSPERIQVDTQQVGKNVESKIGVDGDIKTLLSTMDDLLACTSTAEKVID